MKKNIKVVEINGLRGIFVIAFAIICAIAGFIVIPAWFLMTAWNWIGIYIYPLPHMSLLHGFMLYAVFVLLYFATGSYKTSLNISSANLNKSHLAAMMKDIDDEK